MTKFLIKDVAIIGAGLGGCALALALSQQDVPIKVYESRSKNSEVIPSGVTLTPNGLRVLDQLGVFARIKERCYIATKRVFKNDRDETIKEVPLGGPEANGYWNHRIWRSLLLDEMKLMLKERNVTIQYDSRFTGLVSDNDTGVDFMINDNPQHASLLIGSDGLHSTIRNYLAPGVLPEYTGLTGIIAHIPWKSVAWPYEDYERNATIQGKPGAIFWIAEDPEGKDIMIGYQLHFTEQSRDELTKLQQDKDKLVEIYRRGYDEHGATARSIIDSVAAHKEHLYLWPFAKMPKLPRWFSNTGRVILLGDGAHALPPSSGQGVNQALEDVYSLTLLLVSSATTNLANGVKEDIEAHSRPSFLEALDFWQRMRQDRIDAVLEWTTNTNNVSRLPEAERKRLYGEGKIREGQGDDTRWLFMFDIDKEVKDWLQSQRSAPLT
ncbi:hypothetical protein AC578_3157 [Pseudocercospora eumusae]|uniref:FAD-binding domain-containing protein n=1 Tax=Pseudocercospora eumusae TaxID=321146 RepID=A0A139HDR3_9PEZI|nr:hypothetical protein AC578_3157 [Pseudocercospora eumusae]